MNASRIKIAFIHCSGLSNGGTERWLQMMAANLPKDQFDVTCFYASGSLLVNQGVIVPDYIPVYTDPFRFAYMQEHNVRLVEFKLAARDIATVTLDWLDTDFWDVFHEEDFDIVQVNTAGPLWYPFNLIKKPVVEFVSLAAGAHNSDNVVRSIHLSQWQRRRWVAAGGVIAKSTVIPIPAFPPSTNSNLRSILGIPLNAVVAGFHQRSDDAIFSEIPLNAYSRLQQSDRYFIIMGGGNRYRHQATELGLKNIHFIDQSGADTEISKFLNTLDIFAHGRKDGETFGTVFAEAMMHGKPCLSHQSCYANAQRETMGPAGLFAQNASDYETTLEKLFNDSALRIRLASKACSHAETYYSLARCVDTLSNIYHTVYEGKKNRPECNNHQYGMSDLGFLYAGNIEDSASIANHVVTGGVPERFEVCIVGALFPFMKSVIDIGANTGLYCCLAAQLCPQEAVIHSFEPQASCCDTLRRTVSLNNWENRLFVHQVGIFSEKKTLLLSLSGTGSTFVNAFNDGKQLPSVSVQVDTIDNQAELLQLTKVDFMKIDVEGAELDVLKGGERLIVRDKPVLFIELADRIRGRNYVNPDYTVTINWLCKHDYLIWKLTENQTLKRVKFPVGSDHLAMYLCIHKTQKELFIKAIFSVVKFRLAIWRQMLKQYVHILLLKLLLKFRKV